MSSQSDGRDQARDNLQYAASPRLPRHRRLFWPGILSVLICILAFPWALLAPLAVGMIFWGEHGHVPWYGAIWIATIAMAPTVLAIGFGVLAVTRSPGRPDRVAGVVAIMAGLFCLLVYFAITPA